VQSATTCSPILKPFPPQGFYELTWAAATDPSRPSSQIVYEIFYSPTPGGEDYSSPTWTTPPGVTPYTVTIPRNAPAYFVVRVRDAAGHEDHNTVERPGVNGCTNAEGPLRIPGGASRYHLYLGDEPLSIRGEWSTSSPMAHS
jgi:hypothetical protein